MNNYVPLNVRSSYSIGDSICQIPRLVRKARELWFPAMALVDTNMHGAKEFHDACRSMSARIIGYGNLPPIKPIIGLAVRIRERGVDAPLVLLAKNKDGYHNLVRIASENVVQGRTGELVVPLDSVLKMNKGVICLAGSKDFDLAEACFSPFCGDFAFMAENDDEEFPDWKIVNVCAMPPVRFIDKDDSETFDAYCALFDYKRLGAKGTRRCAGTEYLMDEEEMTSFFPRHPTWVENTMRLAEKIEEYSLDEIPEIVEFPIPPEFPSSMAYLRHLVAEGASTRWGTPLPREVSDRLQYELSVIEHLGNVGIHMDFASYFLIVHDYVEVARRMGAWVGPGRGAAAGSAVTYALGITGVDPIKHGLLFERFLISERISMPDIDIDFDDWGRSKVVKYIYDKYGHDRVAHIVTFGWMVPKSAIKDVSRVVGMSIEDANRLARLVPDMPRLTFSRAYNESKDLRNAREHGGGLDKKVLRMAEKLEGCICQLGVHACGIVVSRRPLSEVLPTAQFEENVRPSNYTDLITQYDGHYVETVGLVKFDILGLKTLDVHKYCVNLIKERKGQVIDLDKIPYDEPETMEVFARGDTRHIFQFESDGMTRWLMALKPQCLNDLVAMNALYGPGLMVHIPTYIRRKNGDEPIVYDHPLMEDVLRETYGMTIYQEQMMALSQKLAGFSRGDSDKMRKAMGRKMFSITEELRPRFVEGCLANREFRIGKWEDESVARKLVDKIWNDWYTFASYAFNKSHAVCYAWLAYQTAYLKAHYPEEFMITLMYSERGNMTRLPELLQEARRMGIQFTQAELDMVQYRHD